MPWEPLLTDEEVQRAEGYYGTGRRIRKVAAKLLAGQPIQVRACCGMGSRDGGWSQVPLGMRRAWRGGMTWHGMVRHGMARLTAAWPGLAHHGMA